MKIDKYSEKPATTNQIKEKHGSINKWTGLREGTVATSGNAGHWNPFYYLKIDGGTFKDFIEFTGVIKTLVPQKATIQRLTMKVDADFCPLTRIWKNADKYQAQRNTTTEPEIKEKPSTVGKTISIFDQYKLNAETGKYEETGEHINEFDTTLKRDSIYGKLAIRFQSGLTSDTGMTTLPAESILRHRATRAIWNELYRNREYDEAMREFNDDEVTSEEMEMYNARNLVWYPVPKNMAAKMLCELNPRLRRNNGYYSDYRTSILDTSVGTDTTGDIMELTEKLKMLPELRTRAENAQKTDREIIAEIGGCKAIDTDRVIKLATKMVGLNFNPIIQTSYNNDANLQAQYKQLGTDGGYSYTQVTIRMPIYREFLQDGYIIFSWGVTSDDVYETGFDRNELNITPEQEYRPDYKNLKQDVLYEIETNGTWLNDVKDLTKERGFKDKFTEYATIPNLITGDATAHRWYDYDAVNSGDSAQIKIRDEEIMTKYAYNYFHAGDNKFMGAGYRGRLNCWEDYTDLRLNANCSYPQKVEGVNDDFSDKGPSYIRVKGENQIFFTFHVADLSTIPVDKEVLDHYQPWGKA